MADPSRVRPVPFPRDPSRSVTLYRCLGDDVSAVGDWLDMYLRDDFFFRRGHLKAVLERESNRVYAVLFDGLFAGIWIEYDGSALHNLYIEAQFRRLGIGEALVQYLRPLAIRAKTDMSTGDPTPFYERLGYGDPHPDPLRPHITLLRDLHAGNTSTAGLGVSAGSVPTVAAATIGSVERPAGSVQPAPSPAPVHPVSFHSLQPGRDYGAAGGALATPDQDSLDAARWRAMKARQRARQQKKSEERRAADARALVNSYPPAPHLNGVQVNGN